MTSVKKEEAEEPDLGQASQDFVLSSAPPSWTAGKRYNVLKFGHAASIEPTNWRKPLKLNRRTEGALRRLEEGYNGPEIEEEVKRKAFQRKTNRIMHSEESQETLQMRKEERNAWLLEDASSSTSTRAQRWTGRFEGTVGTGTDNAQAAKSHYVFLVLDHQTNDFKVIPANRIYNFSKRPNRNVLDAEQADKEFSRRNRSFWSGHGRNDSISPSARVRVKAEPVESHRLLGKAVKKEDEAQRLRKAGERKMKAKFDRDLFGSDDEGRRDRLDDDEQGFDEFDYEEDIQDDEEGAGMEVDDAVDAEENRQAEEGRKRELRAANRSGDEEDEDIEKKELDSAGKRAKKLMRRMGRVEYESDDDPEERNPYASDKDSSSDAEANRSSINKQSAKSAKVVRAPGSARPSLPGSRAGSPSPSLNAGSAAVARRATSPRPHTPRDNSSGPSKRKAEDGSRSGSKRARTATPVDGKDLSDADIIEFLRKSKGQMVPIVDVLKYAKKVLGFDVKNRLADIQSVLDRVGTRQAGAVMLRPELE